METFTLLAQPWWVNSAIFIPFILYGVWRRRGSLVITKRQLVWALVFAAAFGYLESAVVVHLRAAIGFLPGYEGTLQEVQRQTVEFYQIAGKSIDESLITFPKSLAVVEFLRNIASMLMLFGVAMLAAKSMRERVALFFWMAAIWDVTYYFFLWLLIRWPLSLTSPDILFLIPVPWISQVWFPILVSVLTVAAVLAARIRTHTV